MSDSQPWKGAFESDDDYQKRCDQARDQEVYESGQADAAAEKCPNEPWKGAFQSDEDYEAEVTKYREGYQNGQDNRS